MNLNLLHPEVQEFIRTYSEDTSVIAFQGSRFEGISVQELMTQIEGFRKTKKKLPLWHSSSGIYFPPRLNIEQTSSEITARYKASLHTGERLADLTGGFGVDCYYFAKRIAHVDYFEKDKNLSDIAAHNFRQLKASHINCHASDGIAGIKGRHYDVIYVDPARRHDSKGKVFFLKDCEPNLLDHQEYLLNHCDTLMVKTSPMLDIAIGLQELQRVAHIHVVAVENEVKELLWSLKKEVSQPFKITTVNFTKEQIEKFEFIPDEDVSVVYSLPKSYLYEPNAAIMKAGGFQHIANALGVEKLHRHSHLYTSEEELDFPGRIFKIERVFPYHNKEMKSWVQGTQANVTTRNFPNNVQELRKKWKIKEGGSSYLFFTKLPEGEKVVIVGKKIHP